MRIAPWLQVLVTATILAVVLCHIPAEQMLQAARSGELIWLLPALATTLAMLFVRYLKWHRLLHAAGLPVKQLDSFRSLLCGFALSVLTPGRVGEFSRCLFLDKSARSQVFQLNVLERALDAWAVFTFAVASLMVIQFRPVGVFALAVWLAVLPVCMGLSGVLGSVTEWKFWRGNVGIHLRAGSQALARVRTAPFAGWALVSTSLDLLIFYFLLQAFHRTEFTAVLITFPWMIIAGGLPIAVGGIGPREGVAAFLLAHRAVPAAAAMDAALFLFVFSAILPAVFGGVWLMARRLRPAELPAPALESVSPEA